jgi:TonB family protein
MSFAHAGPAKPASGDREPDWLRKPTAQDLMAVWPRAAMQKGVKGKAVVSCVVTIQGKLRDCTVASETPTGLGFGAAAIALTSQFIMTPALKNGEVVEGTARIPINFDMPYHRPGEHSLQDDMAMGTKVVSIVNWVQAPTVADVIAAYPPQARAQKLSGAVTLDCAIGKAGQLTNCLVLREDPQSAHFGQAARMLSKTFVGPTTDGAGKSLKGAHTQLSITFAKQALEADQRPIGKPRWVTLPAAEDLADVLPPAAKASTIARARVVMSCKVAAEGKLAGCTVESEDPIGLGLGEATLKIANTFQLSIWTVEGLPTVGGTVRVPVVFVLNDAPPTAAAK